MSTGTSIIAWRAHVPLEKKEWAGVHGDGHDDLVTVTLERTVNGRSFPVDARAISRALGELERMLPEIIRRERVAEMAKEDAR